MIRLNITIKGTKGEEQIIQKNIFNWIKENEDLIKEIDYEQDLKAVTLARGDREFA